MRPGVPPLDARAHHAKAHARLDRQREDGSQRRDHHTLDRVRADEPMQHAPHDQKEAERQQQSQRVALLAQPSPIRMLAPSGTSCPICARASPRP